MYQYVLTGYTGYKHKKRIKKVYIILYPLAFVHDTYDIQIDLYPDVSTVWNAPDPAIVLEAKPDGKNKQLGICPTKTEQKKVPENDTFGIKHMNLQLPGQMMSFS